MKLGLEDKRALVMGSSRGLGFGIAKALMAEGAAVMLCGRQAQSLEAARQSLQVESGGRVKAAVADLADQGSLEKLVHSVQQDLGGLDILVNNCGGPPPGPISMVDTAQWQQFFNSMASSVFYLTSCFLPAMREQRWGRILNIASSGVQQPIPVLGISNAIRSSIVGWAKTLSLEIAADGVTINTILPGRISTERLQQLNRSMADNQGKSLDDVVQASLKEIPMGRFGEVREFAAVATFLLSEPASYVTGSQIRVDGGVIKSI